jgi:hypothetical protein
MFGSVAKFDHGVSGRLRRSKKLFGGIDRVVEVVVVSLASVNTQLAAQLGREFHPIATQNMSEIVVLAPMCGCHRIDFARIAIPETSRIPVLTHR